MLGEKPFKRKKWLIFQEVITNSKVSSFNIRYSCHYYKFETKYLTEALKKNLMKKNN